MTHKEEAQKLVEDFSECGEDGCMWINTAIKISILHVEKTLSILPKLVSAEGYGSALFDNPMVDRYNKIKKELEEMI